MKYLIIASLLLFVFSIESSAQSDSLVIMLKNNQVEKIAVSQIQSIKFENLTGIEESFVQPDNLIIEGNYPNPFQELTNIEFNSASNGTATVCIYDYNGYQIQKIECPDCHTGNNTVQWNGLDKNNNRVQSGVYYYEIRFNNEIQTRNMILIK